MESTEINDNIQGNIIFKLLPGKWRVDPVARFEVENIEFSASDNRHITTQISIGAEKIFFSKHKDFARNSLEKASPRENYTESIEL